MAPSQTFGPFLDEHGLLIWFDFFFPTRLVQVFLQGSSTPALLIPLWGALTEERLTASKPAAPGLLPA